MALTGPDLISGTTNGNTLPAQIPGGDGSWEERIISVTPYEVTSGVQYAIIFRAPSAEHNSALRWSIKHFGTPIFISSSDSGSNWSQNSSYGGWFTVDGDSYNPSGTIADGCGLTQWRGHIFTASSTYTVNSITLRLQRSSAGGTADTVGTITASIRTVVDPPTKAKTPAPTDAASDVTLDQATLTWEDGGNADTYNVYYGDTSGNLTLVSSAQAGTSLTVTGITLGSPYDYVVTRYWRIDSINAGGTTTGDEWSFTTINFDQLRVTYELISGGSGNGPYDTPTPGVEGTDFRYTGENNMITVRRLIAAANNKIWIEDI